MSSATTSSGISARVAEATLVHLRVLATSDLHASLMPFDYFTDRPDDRIGLVRVGGLVEADAGRDSELPALGQRRHVPGGHAGRACREGHAGFDPHPMIMAMNALRYDAATLGNHDFDYGIDMLDRILSEAAFPRCARQRPASRQRGALPAAARDPRTRSRGSRWRPTQVADRRDREPRRRRSPNGTAAPWTGRWFSRTPSKPPPAKRGN
jgi:hypothetical protein